MFHQSGGRNQRPKGLKVKKAVQVSLLVAVSVWLLCQIKNTQFWSATPKPKPSGKPERMDLGRKGNAGGSNGEDEMDFDDGNFGNVERDGGDGDDELDRNSEEAVRQESLLKSREHLDEHVTDGEAKEKKTETKQDGIDALVQDEGKAVGLDSKEKDSEENAEDGLPKIEGLGSRKDEDSKVNAEEMKDRNEALGSDKADDSKVNAEEMKDSNEALGPEDAMLSHAETESRVAPNGVHDFHDENGIPPDGSETVGMNKNAEIAEGSDSKTLHDGGETLPEPKTSGDSSKPVGAIDNAMPTSKKAKLDEIGNASETGSGTSSGTQVGTTIGSSVELETGDKSDKSRIDGVSKAMHEGPTVSDKSSYISSLGKPEDKDAEI